MLCETQTNSEYDLRNFKVSLGNIEMVKENIDIHTPHIHVCHAGINYYCNYFPLSETLSKRQMHGIAKERILYEVRRFHYHYLRLLTLEKGVRK